MSNKTNPNRKSRLIKRHEKFADCLDFEKIFSVNNVYRASQECRRGFNWKKPVQDFNFTPYVNSKVLSEEIIRGTYQPRILKSFVINERGKTRVIKPVSYRDRIVQKCLCDYSFSPVITPLLINTNSASQKGKGTSFAARMFEKHLRNAYIHYSSSAYLLSIDITKYFDSVPSNLACDKLLSELRRIAINPHELESVGRIRDVTSMYMLRTPGLELGNQLSQIAAIFYCNDIDHFVLEKLHLPYYGRYMDDSYVFCPTLDAAKEVCQILLGRYKQIGLTVSAQKTLLEPVLTQHMFLKTIFKLDENLSIYKTLPNLTFRRYKRRLQSLKALAAKGRIGSEVVYESLASFKSLAIRTSNPTKALQTAMNWV